MKVRITYFLILFLLFNTSVFALKIPSDSILVDTLLLDAYEDKIKKNEIEGQLLRDKAEAEEKESKQTKIVSSIVVFFIIILAALIFYNSYKVKEEALIEIEKKSKLILEQEEKLKSRNFDLEQGLFYAKRIQEAILPLEEDIVGDFNDAFILFKPKNEVGGDFYWSSTIANHQIISVIDCTGHGIAGGYMALMANDLLNEIVRDKSVNDVAMALTHMNLKLVKSFTKINDNEQIIDGMEVALCAINKDTLELSYAGAYRHLYLMRNGILEVINGDNQMIGNDSGLRKQFTLQTKQLQKGDILYLHTDGYVNQFGGPESKKFKYKQLQQLLVENYNKPLLDQKEILLQKHIDWKGSHEQIDDICIVGLKI